MIWILGFYVTIALEITYLYFKTSSCYHQEEKDMDMVWPRIVFGFKNYNYASLRTPIYF